MTISICQPIKQPKPCAKHGVVERTKDGRCAICNKERCKKYLINNEQKVKDYRKKYRKENIDKLIKINAEYKKNNKDKIKQQSKKYYEENADKLREESRLRRVKNIEKSLETAKKWIIDNPERSKNIRKKWRNNNPYANCLVIQKLAAMKAYFSLGLKSEDIPPELVELKRLQMKLHHAIKAREQQTGERNEQI